MELDTDKIDEDVLALLYLTSFRENKGYPWRTWKSHDWDVMDRLCAKGFISDPKSKAKSVVFTDEGYERAKQLFEAKYARMAKAAIPSQLANKPVECRTLLIVDRNKAPLASGRTSATLTCMKTFTAVIERDPATGLLVGYVPGLPGAHTQAETLDELNANLREVIELVLEDGAPELQSEFIGTQTIRVA